MKDYIKVLAWSCLGMGSGENMSFLGFYFNYILYASSDNFMWFLGMSFALFMDISSFYLLKCLLVNFVKGYCIE